MSAYNLSTYKNFEVNDTTAIHIGASIGAVIINAVNNFIYDKSDNYFIPLLLTNAGAVIGCAFANYINKSKKN